jgi:[glutamine synthetase] adenylyltransferase / [glutamine synthetase]-adenylyl-L-tyrosine phosphorylase
MSLPELSRVRFADPRRAERSFNALQEHLLASGSLFRPDDLTRALDAHLPDAADPDMALAGLLRFTEATISRAGLFNDLLRHDVLLDMLVRVFGDSMFFTDILVRDPGLFRWLTATGVLQRTDMAGDIRAEAQRIAESFPRPDRRLDPLRRLLRREVLRIGVQDVLGLADLRTVTIQLSELADILIDAAVDASFAQLKLKYNLLPDQPFAVIGLGKLGGKELNYSSDVDLLFVFGEDGSTPGLKPTHHEFFIDLAEKIVQNITASTPEGHMYRVDMRLRPEAGAGSLARSLSGYLQYYEARGELWERQMLIKARTVAGSMELGERFLGAIQPFVYPRTFMEHPAESIARIKGRIEASIGDAENVKLMPGGIRDIEFIVQALQLVNGGRKPHVRTGNTIEAIEALHNSSLLGEHEARALTDAYCFLRTVEHRMQTMHNTQVHTLPPEAQSLSRLARRVELPGAGELQDAIAKHRSGVRTVFDSVMHVSGDLPTSDIGALLDGLLPEAQAHELLRKYRFNDVRQALRNLRVLSGGSGLLNAEETESRLRSGFRKLAGTLLQDIAGTPDPDLTLHALAMIADAQIAPAAFHTQLANPGFRKLLVDISSFGTRFARTLASDPALLEAVTADVSIIAGSSPLTLPPAANLAQFKRHREFRACMRHLLGFAEYGAMTAELGEIAEFVLSNVVSSTPAGPPFAVFAAGKFGTREAGLDADLDLLFVADAPGVRQLSTAEKKATKIVAALSEVGPEGRLYETDLRLRPEGRNAPLVVDVGRYGEYLATRASLWERQMLTRLRFVCGDARLGERVMQLVHHALFSTPLPPGWVQSIVDMRRKMETRSRTRGSEIVDVKLGPGGMADVEFIAQMWILAKHAPPPADGTIGGILLTAVPGFLTERESVLMAEAYALYRRLELLMRVTLNERASILPEGPRIETLARRHGMADGQKLLAHVSATMKEVRKVFLAASGRLMKGEVH